MTKDVENPYKFIGKPSFLVMGELHSDSINWVKNKLDPYSLSVRYEQKDKDIPNTDRARKPKKQSVISYSKKKVDVFGSKLNHVKMI